MSQKTDYTALAGTYTPPKTAQDVMHDMAIDFEERSVAQQAAQSGYAYVDMRTVTIQSDIAANLDLTACEAVSALPYMRVGRALHIAVSAPDSPEVQSFTASYAKRYDIAIEMASHRGIQQRLSFLRSVRPERPEAASTENAEDHLTAASSELSQMRYLADKAPLMTAEQLASDILVGALRAKASDVHLQSEDDALLVRFRIDGILHTAVRLSYPAGDNLLDHLKYSARLHLNVKNVPQDGRFSFSASGRDLDLRVSVLPTEKGESLVMRLLDSSRKLVSFPDLGFTGQTLSRLQDAENWTGGLVLLTGPTGSGKTTTLYTLLDLLNTPDRKLATLEDPVEYRLPRIVQTTIDEASGMTFAAGLKSLLRQDPDVILVGEIRDLDTALTACQAAMTGHLVLSTLHTTTATEAVPRLLSLGVPPYLLAASLRLIITQRLVRKVHLPCAHSRPVTQAEAALLGVPFVDPTLAPPAPDQPPPTPTTILETGGCEACSGSGYLGRSVIAESILADSGFQELILRNASLPDYQSYLAEHQHMQTLRDSALEKIKNNITTLSEVCRVVDILNS